MRIKKFTLFTLALLQMSVVAFAQIPSSSQGVLNQSRKIHQAYRTGQLTQDNLGEFQMPKVTLPQDMLKANKQAEMLPTAKATKKNLQAVKRLKGSAMKRNVKPIVVASSVVAPSDPDNVTITLTAGDVWGDGSGYQMLLDADATAYGTIIPTEGALTSSGDASASVYEAFEYKIPTNADGSLSTENIVVNNSITIEIPAGTYDWCITNPTAGDRMWIVSAGNVGGRANDYVFEAGHNYEFTVSFGGSNDRVDVTIDGEEPVTEPAGDLVELPDGVEPVTYYTTGGVFYVSTSGGGWQDATSYMPSVQVGIDGSDIYIQGLSYYFNDAWIKGTIENGIATFASGQYIGTDDYGDEYLVGSNDGETVAPIIFALDEEAGTLTAQTMYIFESETKDEVNPYTYWYNAEFDLTGIRTVEIPEGLETSEYVFTAYDISWEVNARRDKNDESEPIYTEYELRALVGFDGNTVYAQGLCSYLPEAWVKGTISGTTVTFPTGQYFGMYDPYAGTIFEGYYLYPMYLLGYGENEIEDVTFELGEANATLTMTSPNYILINETKSTVDPYMITTGAVYTLIPDVAATPALPKITSATLTDSYPYIAYNIPIVDEEDNPLIRSKLSYQIYVDVDQEVSPLTLTTDLYEELEEDMTEIPYTFTDNWDVYNDELYLNQGDFTGWRRIGIQSIYCGGGEENRSEIAWYALYNYSVRVPADGYATFYIDDAVTLDPASIEAGAELLTVTAATENAVTVSALDAADSNTPLLIYNGAEKKKSIKLIPTDAPEEMATVASEFKGTLQDMTFDEADMEQANHYVLNENNFVWVCESGTIKANRCWLEFGMGVKTAPLLKIVRNGDTTGINDVNANDNVNDNGNGNYYDLQGRIVNVNANANVKAGIYIQNGKKFVIK